MYAYRLPGRPAPALKHSKQPSHPQCNRKCLPDDTDLQATFHTIAIQQYFQDFEEIKSRENRFKSTNY